MTAPTRTAYLDYEIWDDSGVYYLSGHIHPADRARDAAARYIREQYGRKHYDKTYRNTSPDQAEVGYGWIRPDPQTDDDDITAAWCHPDHPGAEPVTVVRPGPPANAQR